MVHSLIVSINCWQSGYCYIQSRADRSTADNCAPDVSSTSHGRWNTTRNADCAPNTGGGEAEQGWVDIDLGDEVLGVRHAPVTTGVQLANVGGSTHRAYAFRNPTGNHDQSECTCLFLSFTTIHKMEVDVKMVVPIL